MILQLAVSTFMVLLTVVIHGGGLAILGRMLRGEVQVELAHHVPGFSLRTMGFTLALVLALFVLHGVGIWLYAFLYEGLGAAIEGINGLLLLGWSTAFFVTIVARLGRR